MERQLDLLQQRFTQYFDYVGISEAPRMYHRWCYITGVAALLGRSTYIPFGESKIYANMYTILVGAAGTRKSTAISIVKKLLRRAGFENFAADRTSKEKFIADMQALNYKDEMEDEGADSIARALSMEIAGTETHPAEMLIAADELQDFMGQSNIDFITMLGVLWDAKDTYEHRVKNSRSSLIHKPYVCLLGGTTSTGFTLAFPPEIVSQGFLSRLLLIYGERTAARIAWPQHNASIADDIVLLLEDLHARVEVELVVTDAARKAAEAIYVCEYDLQDGRLDSYMQRRYTHMLKCAIVCSALRNAREVEECDIIAANTFLWVAEQKMSNALGEFGKSKLADVATQVMELLSVADRPLSMVDIWRQVATDLSAQKDLQAVLSGLTARNKIKAIQLPGKVGYVINHQQVAMSERMKDYIIPELISEEEVAFDV